MIHELHKAHACAPGGIKTIDQLHFHLQVAMELELSTIPPYLCALYSIHDGSNVESARVIRSVAMEEMLHVTLVGNVLNAIQGEVQLTRHVPMYPTKLPHSDGAFEVSLRKFSHAAIDTFLRIEHPERPHTKPKSEGYSTIGQFYAAIEKGLKKVCKDDAYFRKRSKEAKQVFPRQYYGAVGSAFPVTDLESALRALRQIVDQGEGTHDSLFTSKRRTRLAVGGFELAHYYRFQQIAMGRLYRDGDEIDHPTGPPMEIDWDAVYQMDDNPRAEDFPTGTPQRAKMDDFNRTYMQLLASVEESLSGDPENLMHSVGAMYELKYKAVELMKIPGGGPSFESIETTFITAA